MLPTTPSTKPRRSGRENTSRQETKNEGFALSLAVYGSSAPIYTPPPKTYRQSKTPKHSKTETKRNFSFPVEKIILLAERLELTSLRERQVESISYFKTGNRVEEDETASGLDFSLDLSSVNAESEESESETVENLHYNSRSSTKRDVVEEKEEEEGKKDDLVNSYVNSVDNQELRKYFRTCRTCREPCCVCPEERKEKLNKAVETEMSMTKFECENGSRSVNGRKYEAYCRSSYCCPDDFLDDYCPECVCKCDSGGLADTERMLSYANSLASAARSARVLARDLESVLSSFKSDTE